MIAGIGAAGLEGITAVEDTVVENKQSDLFKEVLLVAIATFGCIVAAATFDCDAIVVTAGIATEAFNGAAEAAETFASKAPIAVDDTCNCFGRAVELKSEEGLDSIDESLELREVKSPLKTDDLRNSS